MNSIETAAINRIAQHNPPRRPNIITIARNVLQDQLEIEPQGKYKLWRMGRWCQVNLDEVMRAANAILKREGREQISLNPAWVIQ